MDPRAEPAAPGADRADRAAPAAPGAPGAPGAPEGAAPRLELVFPSAWGERRQVRVAGARGVAFGELAPALVALLERWAATGAPTGLSSLKKERVLRGGGLVFKRYPRPSLLGRLARRPPAVRAAELGLRLLPLRSPRPLLALAGLGRAREGLLVSEFLHGRLLREAWPEDAAARRALPAFLAALHARRVLHGDLHPRNLVWSEGAWALLDVVAVRHGLHRVHTARLALGQWARLLLYLGDEHGLESAFREYTRLSGALFRDASRWEHVVRETRRMLRARDRPPPRPSRHLLPPEERPPP